MARLQAKAVDGIDRIARIELSPESRQCDSSDDSPRACCAGRVGVGGSPED
jgi:hypothetical protein